MVAKVMKDPRARTAFKESRVIQERKVWMPLMAKRAGKVTRETKEHIPRRARVSLLAPRARKETRERAANQIKQLASPLSLRNRHLPNLSERHRASP